MVKFFVSVQRAALGTRLRVYTQSDPASLIELLKRYGVAEWTTIQRVAPGALPRELRSANVGLSFVRPTLSKMVSSPTKVGEYLAAGLPVVSTTRIGDLDEMLAGTGNHKLGVIVSEDSEAAYAKAAHELIALMQTEGVRDRCRAAARHLLDLETVGWPPYRRLYERLA